MIRTGFTGYDKICPTPMTNNVRPPAPSRAQNGLTTEQFAQAAGVPIHHIHYAMRTGELVPAVRGGGRGHKRLFTHEQVQAFVQMREDVAKRIEKEANALMRAPVPALKFEYSGEHARECFDAWDRGEKISYGIRKLGLHPAAVRAIWHEYTQIDGGIALPKETIDKIAMLNLDGPLPPRNHADVLELLQTASADARCEQCAERPKSVCVKCARAAIKAAVTAKASRASVANESYEPDPASTLAEATPR